MRLVSLSSFRCGCTHDHFRPSDHPHPKTKRSCEVDVTLLDVLPSQMNGMGVFLSLNDTPWTQSSQYPTPSLLPTGKKTVRQVIARPRFSVRPDAAQSRPCMT